MWRPTATLGVNFLRHWGLGCTTGRIQALSAPPTRPRSAPGRPMIPWSTKNCGRPRQSTTRTTDFGSTTTSRRSSPLEAHVGALCGLACFGSVYPYHTIMPVERRTRRAGGARRAAVVEAAAGVLAERGYENARFADVAQASGAAISTLQSY